MTKRETIVFEVWNDNGTKLYRPVREKSTCRDQDYIRCGDHRIVWGQFLTEEEVKYLGWDIEDHEES